MEVERIKEAVERITMTDDTRQRILQGIEQRKAKKRAVRLKSVLTAACALLFLCVGILLPIQRKETMQWGIIAYAKEAEGSKEAGWMRLKEGEKVLLEKDPEMFRYEVEIEVPENYYYERSGAIIGNDYIRADGNKLYWTTDIGESQYPLPDIMSTSMRILVLDENRERTGVIYLTFTKEYDKCYVEMERK